ncbi:probable serine/threonine-protein kinase PBL28 [Cryptomeria japonica]|uniref:probable serine/threonine-protein kinase PBL28 n=1 Tax=Cryptomeria japonica TaxID=3369 RepID=UPI0027DA9550|nr:probable serine/threonine-protein kinase PBL28 [Cryptomeria japonica]
MEKEQLNVYHRKNPKEYFVGYKFGDNHPQEDKFDDEEMGESNPKGKVYKGKLPNGQFIAIKHIYKDIPQADTFEKEIEIISKIKHKNLVSLLGYCDENGDKYFVYEYCANGNLSQMLLGLEDKALTWEQRVKIAYDSIAGLRCLHLYPDGCTVHRDIKPTNILLTESMEAKLADFGLLRMFKIQDTNVFTEVKGTLGYLDPDYASQGRLTCSTDVYSFGIVLLQLLSGRRAIDIDQSNRESLLNKASFLRILSFV